MNLETGGHTRSRPCQAMPLNLCCFVCGCLCYASLLCHGMSVRTVYVSIVLQGMGGYFTVVCVQPFSCNEHNLRHHTSCDNAYVQTRLSARSQRESICGRALPGSAVISRGDCKRAAVANSALLAVRHLDMRVCALANQQPLTQVSGRCVRGAQPKRMSGH